MENIDATFGMMRQRWGRGLVVILALGHFVWGSLGKREWIETRAWNQSSCVYSKGRRDIADLDCRYFYTRKSILAQPYLKYGETLNCHKLSGPEAQAFPETDSSPSCPEIWGRPTKFPDLGWDAHAIWYGRAAMLYFRSQAADWPGILTALRDPAFIKSLPDREHWHYPWLLPWIYAQVLKVQGSPNPVVLIVLQFLVFVATVFLYRATWLRAPKYLWIAFAFVPIAGVFLSYLYADLWVLAFLLIGLAALERRRWLVWALASMCVFWIKQEAAVQWIALLATYLLLQRPAERRMWLRSYPLTLAALVLASMMGEKIWGAKSYDAAFYIAWAARLRDPSTYTHLLPLIAGYYLDVLLRPKLWGALWHMVFYFTYRSRAVLGWSLLPLGLVLLLIPMAFVTFPFGHKEVVLTASGRALWQALPLAWLLLKRSRELREAERPTRSAKFENSL